MGIPNTKEKVGGGKAHPGEISKFKNYHADDSLNTFNITEFNYVNTEKGKKQ